MALTSPPSWLQLSWYVLKLSEVHHAAVPVVQLCQLVSGTCADTGPVTEQGHTDNLCSAGAEGC